MSTSDPNTDNSRPASAGANSGTSPGAGELDWQIAPLIRATRIDPAFRVTQNVMRFFKRSCGQNFAMEKEFQAWLCDGTPKTLGEAADAWNEYSSSTASNQQDLNQLT